MDAPQSVSAGVVRRQSKPRSTQYRRTVATSATSMANLALSSCSVSQSRPCGREENTRRQTASSSCRRSVGSAGSPVTGSARMTDDWPSSVLSNSRSSAMTESSTAPAAIHGTAAHGPGGPQSSWPRSCPVHSRSTPSPVGLTLSPKRGGGQWTGTAMCPIFPQMRRTWRIRMAWSCTFSAGKK